MKRLLSAYLIMGIMAVLCIMAAGVPIYGYQVILDPIAFTEMEFAKEKNLFNWNSRKTNKRLVGLDMIPEAAESDQNLEFGQQNMQQNENPWPNLRKRRSAFAMPIAFAFAKAYPEPDPKPIDKSKGFQTHPRGYSYNYFSRRHHRS